MPAYAEALDQSVSNDALCRYQTTRHEAIHVVANHVIGGRALSVTIGIHCGETILEWPIHTRDISRLQRENRAETEHLMRGVVRSIIAPALGDREPVNPLDLAALTRWRLAWPHAAVTSWDTLYRQACLETHAWLSQRDTMYHVHKLTQALFCYDHIEGAPLQQVIATVLPVCKPAPARPAPKPTPKPAPKKPGKDALDLEVEHLIAKANQQQKLLEKYGYALNQIAPAIRRYGFFAAC